MYVGLAVSPTNRLSTSHDSILYVTRVRAVHHGFSCFLSFVLGRSGCIRMDVSPSNFGHTLSIKERPCGQYPITVATLDLLATLVKGLRKGPVSQPDDEKCLDKCPVDLVASVLFVVHDIFSSFHRWRYVDIKDRDVLGTTKFTRLRSLRSLFVNMNVCYTFFGKNVAFSALLTVSFMQCCCLLLCLSNVYTVFSSVIIQSFSSSVVMYVYWCLRLSHCFRPG